jgi:hypothetical protein
LSASVDGAVVARDILIAWRESCPESEADMPDLLKYGAKGPEVENLQEALNYHMFDMAPALKVDGKFGDKTHARVFAFQRRRGLGQDGTVGPETRDALYDFIRSRVHVFGLHGPQSLKLPQPRVLRLTGNDQDEPVPPFPRLRFPRLELPFPEPAKPPNFFPIPQLTLAGQTFSFEVTAGAQRTFHFFSSVAHEPKLKHTLFTDVELVVWRRPVGKYFELALGPGMWFERVLGGPDPTTSIHTGIFVNAEFAVEKKLTPRVDLIAKLIAEGKLQGSAKGPVELSSETAIGANPVLEVRDLPFIKKLEFGPKATVFFEIGYADKNIAVKAGATIEGAITGHF